MNKKHVTPIALLLVLLGTGCSTTRADQDESAANAATPAPTSEPLVSHIYTADPSAHVFEGKLFIYPSHDVEAGVPEDDLGSHFDMRDYHVLSMDEVGGKVTDHGVALDIQDVPWAGRQMWAPDAAFKNDVYYLYFPVKDKEDIFRLGVATSNRPQGPFKAQPEPVNGSYSIDPAVFQDDDGSHYMYFGGIWGGQLQKWRTGKYVSTSDSPTADEPAENEPAIAPRIAKMTEDMLQFAEPPKKIQILDDQGDPILAGDHDRRFFEAAWMHTYDGNYYLSYSTGDTHYIAYGIGDNPYGPFTYKGVILKPVLGWTNHHSIVEFKGKWYLFYHDSSLSGGKTHLRNVKVSPLTYRSDGTIETIDPYKQP